MSNDHNHNPTQNHLQEHNHNKWTSKWPLIIALVMLVVMQILELGFDQHFHLLITFTIYLIAYLLSGYDVLYLAWKKTLHFDFFNEFVLMSVATIGAFSIGAFSEGVAVMVFYAIGEWFQDVAVDRAKKNIKTLLDIRPDHVNRIQKGKLTQVPAKDVNLDEIIQVKPGEKVALDGILFTERGTFNTAALTGESVPQTKIKGEIILAGMISVNTLIEVQVKALFKDSKLSKILAMVQDATSRKSKTQLFISKFAAIYTPIVFLLALLLVLLPLLFIQDYHFKDWLYRGLVFLVISCPCALVVSIPLGYFGGIGLASRNGILFKGANFLDIMAKVDTVVMDKTGTLTKGVFKVQHLVASGVPMEEFLQYLGAIESKSSHPISVAITTYKEIASKNLPEVSSLEEIPGYGLKAFVKGKHVLTGNTKLLQKHQITYDSSLDQIAETIVVLAIDKTYAGYVIIADEVKEDAKHAVQALLKANIKVVMLSGDKYSVVKTVAEKLGIKDFSGDLLPEQKVERFSQIKASGRTVAFVGDGVNDAPVIALADAGIAMGGLGSDAAIEIADIVIQNDQPSKIMTMIKVGRITRTIVWQNIILAMGVKIIVLALGAGGLANLWEAVIADVGVALLAILNAIRIQKFKL